MQVEYAVTFMISMILIPMIIVLWMGKGAFLIAGYNTSSKEERECYDERKLCRCVAIVLLIAEICMILQALHLINTIIFLAIILPTTVIGLIYGNTKCKKG